SRSKEIEEGHSGTSSSLRDAGRRGTNEAAGRDRSAHREGRTEKRTLIHGKLPSVAPTKTPLVYSRSTTPRGPTACGSAASCRPPTGGGRVTERGTEA